MQYTLFVIIAPLSAIACGSIAIYAWRARNISGSKHLAQYAAIAFAYLLLNLLELLLRSETGTLWMAKLEYIFYHAPGNLVHLCPGIQR